MLKSISFDKVPSTRRSDVQASLIWYIYAYCIYSYSYIYIFLNRFNFTILNHHQVGKNMTGGHTSFRQKFASSDQVIADLRQDVSTSHGRDQVVPIWLRQPKSSIDASKASSPDGEPADLELTLATPKPLAETKSSPKPLFIRPISVT